MNKEELLEKFKEPIKVLDDGFVRLVDVMGDDKAIVDAARISYGKGTKAVSTDEALIRYLIRHGHTSPLEMCEIKLHIRIPMDAWRQYIRHRTMSVNEYSTRYSEVIDSAMNTDPGEWRTQSKDNKQGSDGFLNLKTGEHLSIREEELHALSKEIYQERLEAGVAREQARKDIPLCTYTEAYVKVDLNNLMRFLKSRMHLHAQLEIREYANTIFRIMSEWVPFSAKAFSDYILNSYTLSSQEVDIIRRCLVGGVDLSPLSKREAKEFSKFFLEERK